MTKFIESNLILRSPRHLMYQFPSASVGQSASILSGREYLRVPVKTAGKDFHSYTFHLAAPNSKTERCLRGKLFHYTFLLVQFLKSVTITDLTPGIRCIFPSEEIPKIGDEDFYPARWFGRCGFLSVKWEQLCRKVERKCGLPRFSAYLRLKWKSRVVNNFSQLVVNLRTEEIVVSTKL
ncbi:hypothetical protein J6590_068076 [Homalodisca vitripennis]|nr:hypothetical protein J6590_068076 [Homalodisca vitripennis]